MANRHDGHEPRASDPTPQSPALAGIRLSTLDLNLLLVFDALYAERSVTRAGHRLSLSQSAVSHALARLRKRFGDDLFVKGPDGMMPTARARSVASKVHSSLANLQSALVDSRFDPVRSERCFTIAADPYAAMAAVGASDLAALVPERMGRQLAGHFGLRLLEPPYLAASATVDDLGTRQWREPQCDLASRSDSNASRRSADTAPASR